MKRLCELLIVLLCGTGFALAQTTMGQPQQSTPPTFPSQQQPGMQHKPDESGPLGQVGASSTTTLAKAESNIKSVLRQQMPTVANRVVVSETEDQKIKLSGTVNSDTAKQQVEQLARTVAPDQTIVNDLDVAQPPLGPTVSGAQGSQGSPDAQPNSEPREQSPHQPMRPPEGR